MKTAILLLGLPLMANVVLSQSAPQNEREISQNGAIAELREMMRQQQEDFQQKFLEQQRTFERKFQEQQKEYEKLRERFNQVTKKQDQLVQFVSRQCAEEFRGPGKEICQQFISIKNLEKRSDDTDPIETVVQQLSQRVDDVTADIQALNSAVVQATDSLYVHWGSSTCASTSQLVYSGVMGGSLYSHSGGATNPLCLPMMPNHIPQPPNMIYGYAALYGAEYEINPLESNDLDAACSLCQTSKAMTVMIPARDTCYPGWTKHYSGYIMANHPEDGRSGIEYICVDSKFEGRPGSGANMNQMVVYLTQAHCGSLPCPPYKEGEIIGCVVCSK